MKQRANCGPAVRYGYRTSPILSLSALEAADSVCAQSAVHLTS